MVLNSKTQRIPTVKSGSNKATQIANIHIPKGHTLETYEMVSIVIIKATWSREMMRADIFRLINTEDTDSDLEF